MSKEGSGKEWFVVSTRPRQEQVALVNLERQGYCAYLPRLTTKKRRRGQWQSVCEPLFPGYLFVQLALGQDNIAPIRSTFGARDLVRFGKHTPSLDSSLIDWFRQQEQQQGSALPDTAAGLFKRGVPVAILNGPFAGLPAVYEMPTSTERALLLITMLGRQASLECHLNDISPITQ